MDTAAETLLIIVSSTLAIFLIVLIVALIYTIKLLKTLRRISEHAENVAESVDAAAATIGKAASPIAIIKMLGSIVDQATKLRKRRG